MAEFSFTDLLLVGLVFGFLSGIYILPFWFIVKKAGFDPAWSLLGAIPFVNLIALYVFAFNTWPNQVNSRYVEHPKHDLLSEVWKCASCNHLNGPAITVCGECGSKRA